MKEREYVEEFWDVLQIVGAIAQNKVCAVITFLLLINLVMALLERMMSSVEHMLGFVERIPVHIRGIRKAWRNSMRPRRKRLGAKASSAATCSLMQSQQRESRTIHAQNAKGRFW